MWKIFLWHYKDSTSWGRKTGDQFPFDPGVLVDDDGSVYLYSGCYTPTPAILTGFKKAGASCPRRVQASGVRLNGDQYIANLRDDSAAGAKYFTFDQNEQIKLTVSGTGSGTVEVSHTPDFASTAAKLTVDLTQLNYHQHLLPS